MKHFQMPKNNLVAMKEKLQSAFPHKNAATKGVIDRSTGEACSSNQSKAHGWQRIVFWGEPDMEAVFIRKGTKVTLSRFPERRCLMAPSNWMTARKCWVQQELAALRTQIFQCPGTGHRCPLGAGFRFLLFLLKLSR